MVSCSVLYNGLESALVDIRAEAMGDCGITVVLQWFVHWDWYVGVFHVHPDNSNICATSVSLRSLVRYSVPCDR